MGITVPSKKLSALILCAPSNCRWPFSYHLRNIKCVSCLRSLTQTREGVWENSRVCVNPSRRWGFTQRLSSSPKLPRVFVSGYVNTASVLYFFCKIYDKDNACRVYIPWCKHSWEPIRACVILSYFINEIGGLRVFSCRLFSCEIFLGIIRKVYIWIWQVDKPQRGCPKRAELPDININTGVQSINSERASLILSLPSS